MITCQLEHHSNMVFIRIYYFYFIFLISSSKWKNCIWLYEVVIFHTYYILARWIIGEYNLQWVKWIWTFMYKTFYLYSTFLLFRFFGEWRWQILLPFLWEGNKRTWLKYLLMSFEPCDLTYSAMPYIFSPLNQASIFLGFACVKLVKACT